MGQIPTLGKVLEDDSRTLKFRCLKCGHTATFDRQEAFFYWGRAATPHSIRQRSTCSECGAKGSAEVWCD